MQSQEVQKCVCSFQQHYDQSSTISRANWCLHDSPGTWGGLSCSHDLYSCSQLSNYCSAAAHCNWYLVAPAAENNPNLFKHSSIFNYEWLHNKLNPGKQSCKIFQNTIIRRLQNVDMDRTFSTVHTGQARGHCWLVSKYFSKELKYIFEHPVGFLSQNQQVMAWKLFVCAPISHVMLRVDDEWFGCQAGEMRSPGLVAGPVLARGSQLYFLLSPGPGPGSHTTTWSLYTPVHLYIHTVHRCQLLYTHWSVASL